MRKEVTVSNAMHEAGHWITGWILDRSSKDIVIATTNVGESYCDRNPHPDFNNLQEINCHLGNRIINLLGGAKAESLLGGEIDGDRYRELVGDYKGAWPDFFIASELFRYYYRSLTPSSRKSFKDEWNLLEIQTERIIKYHERFINNVAQETLNRWSDDKSSITISNHELLNILNITCE